MDADQLYAQCVRFRLPVWDPPPPFCPDAADVSRLLREGALTLLVQVERNPHAPWPPSIPDGPCWVFAVDATKFISADGLQWRQLLLVQVEAVRRFKGDSAGTVSTAYSELQSFLSSKGFTTPEPRVELSDGSGVWAVHTPPDPAAVAEAERRLRVLGRRAAVPEPLWGGDAISRRASLGAVGRWQNRKLYAADSVRFAAGNLDAAYASLEEVAEKAAGAASLADHRGRGRWTWRWTYRRPAHAGSAGAVTSGAASQGNPRAEPPTAAASAAAAKARAPSAAAAKASASSAAAAAPAAAAAVDAGVAAAPAPRLLVNEGPRLCVVARDADGTGYMFSAARVLALERLSEAGWVALPRGAPVGGSTVVLTPDMLADADGHVSALCGEKVARLFIAIALAAVDADGADAQSEAVLFVANRELRLWKVGEQQIPASSFRTSYMRYRREINSLERSQEVFQVVIAGRTVRLLAWAEERYTDVHARTVSLVGEFRTPFAALFGTRASEALPPAGRVALAKKSKARSGEKARQLDAAAQAAAGKAAGLRCDLTWCETLGQALAAYAESHDHLAIRLCGSAAAALLRKSPGATDAATDAAVRAVTRRVPGGSTVLDLRIRTAGLDQHVPAVPDSIEPALPDVVSISSHIAFANGLTEEITAAHVQLLDAECFESVGDVPLETCARGLLLLTNQEYVTASPEVVGGDIRILQWMLDIDLVHLILRGTVTPARLSEMLWFASCMLHSWDDEAMSTASRDSDASVRFTPGARDGEHKDAWAAAG